jgi:hypothetical protein
MVRTAAPQQTQQAAYTRLLGARTDADGGTAGQGQLDWRGRAGQPDRQQRGLDAGRGAQAAPPRQEKGSSGRPLQGTLLVNDVIRRAMTNELLWSRGRHPIMVFGRAPLDSSSEFFLSEDKNQ